MRIAEIQDGMKRISVTAKVVEKGAVREVVSRFRSERYRICDAVVGDETGTIKLTLWNDQIDAISTGDYLAIEGAYATSFRGETQLNVGKFGSIKMEVPSSTSDNNNIKGEKL